MALTERIVRAAGNLAEKHGLRGVDAIHLASALALRSKEREDSPAIVFGTADRRLAEAAAAEGF